MVESIDEAQVIEFSDKVHEEAQQQNSRLKPVVQIKQMQGDHFAYDGLGSVEAREITGRNVPATFDDIEHNRRQIIRRRFVINLPVDASDVRGALQDPVKNYAGAIAKGASRQFDRLIAEAAFLDVRTGRDFQNTVTAVDDGVITVDETAGLVYEKLLEIKENFIDNEVGNDDGVDENDEIYLTITGAEHTQLMQEEELISGDFTRDFVVEKGRVIRAAGIKLIAFGANVPKPIIPVISAQRKLIAATSRGICLGISKDMSIKVQERIDLIETVQVQVIFEIGAVRTEGALLQQVDVTA